MSHSHSKWGDILSKVYYAMAIAAMLIGIYKYFHPEPVKPIPITIHEPFKLSQQPKLPQQKTDAPPMPVKVDNAPIVVAPVVDPAEIAFNNLYKSQKLADWKNFVATYPKSTHLNVANVQITALEQELKRALNDANAMKQDFPEDAKKELLKAKNIAPERSEVIALEKLLNKK